MIPAGVPPELTPPSARTSRLSLPPSASVSNWKLDKEKNNFFLTNAISFIPRSDTNFSFYLNQKSKSEVLQECCCLGWVNGMFSKLRSVSHVNLFVHVVWLACKKITRTLKREPKWKTWKEKKANEKTCLSKSKSVPSSVPWNKSSIEEAAEQYRQQWWLYSSSTRVINRRACRKQWYSHN